MHALKSTLLIAGLVLLGSACSSGLDDNAQTSSPTSAFDAKFKIYDKTGRGEFTAQELLDVERAAESPTIKDVASATEVLESVDMNGDQKIDKVEFTALVERDILVGLKK